MEKIVEKIVEYFEEHEKIFNECVEELDNYNGYLNDDRYYPMYLLIEAIQSEQSEESLKSTIRDIICGSGEYGKFDIHALYYKRDCYGLESSDSVDYFAYLNDQTVLELYKNRHRISAIKNNLDLDILYDEMDDIFSVM